MRKKMLATMLLGLALITTPTLALAEEGQDVTNEGTPVAEVVVAEPADEPTVTPVAEPAPTQPAAVVPVETPVATGGGEVSAPAETPVATGNSEVSVPTEAPAADPQPTTDPQPTADAPVEGEAAAAPATPAATTDTPAQTTKEPAASKAIEGEQALGAPVAAGDAPLAAPTAEDDAPQQAPAIANDAVYSISASSAPSYNVAAKSNGNVELAKNGTLIGEYWRAVDCGDGGYLLVNLDGSRALAVSGEIKNGTNVIVAATGTRWAFIPNADGQTYTVIPLGHDGFCLDVYGAGTTVGSNLQLYARNGNSTQCFSFALQYALTEAVANAVELEGAYTIKPQANSSLSFDIASGSKSAGANTRLWTANGSLAQTYDLTPLGNGLYLIRAGHSGKVLEVQGGSTSAGANVRQYNRNNTLAQIWYLIADGSGYRIRNAKSGLAMDLDGGSATKSANVQLGSGSKASQLFKLTKTSLLANNSVYSLTSQKAKSLYVAVANNSASTSAAIKTATNSVVLGQFWRTIVQSDGSVVLVNLRSDAALGASKVAKGSTLKVSTTPLALKVQLNDDGSLTFRPISNTSLVLDIQNGSTTAGAALQFWTSNGSEAQRFIPTLNSPLTAAVKTGSPVKTGVYKISVASNPSFVLDIASGSKAAGANVQLYSSNGTMAQKYVFTSLGNGLYTIQAANSGKMLSVANNATKSGSNVVQANRSGNLAQCWYMVSNGSGGYSIRNARSGNVLDVYKGSIAKKSNIQIHTYNGTAAEQFKLSSAPLIKDGTYSFSSALTITSLVLEVSGGSTAEGGNVSGHQANGTEAQKWVVKHVGGGSFTLKNLKSGLYLDVVGSSTSNGANVQQSAQSGSDSQRWVIGVTDSGSLTFMNVKSGKYLDVENGKVANGVNVRQWTGNNTPSQAWNIKTDNNPLPSGKLGTFVRRMVYYCDIANVGYDQSNRWDIRDGGECDCSSLAITCLYEAGFITSKEYQKTIHYTGNMSEVLTKLGWKRINKVNLSTVKPGDILLNDAYHVCVVVSGTGTNAMVAQASIDENGNARGGQAGDQTAYETNIKKVYKYSGGWDCILRYTG